MHDEGQGRRDCRPEIRRSSMTRTDGRQRCRPFAGRYTVSRRLYKVSTKTPRRSLRTHLDGVIIQWIHSFNTKANADEYKDGAIAPLHTAMAVSSCGVNGRPRGSVHIRFVEGAVGSHSNPKASIREVIYKGSSGGRPCQQGRSAGWLLRSGECRGQRR